MTGRGESCETFEPGLTVEFEDILRIVNMLNPRKASGTDWISAELLQAGGGHTARHFMSIGRTMVSSGKWASQLAGAWIANTFKKKGDEQQVDAWRGVQVGSQVAKVLTGWLQSLRICASLLVLTSMQVQLCQSHAANVQRCGNAAEVVDGNCEPGSEQSL